MATPATTQLDLFTTVPEKGTNWNKNWTQLVNWLTDGTADLNTNSLTAKTITASTSVVFADASSQVTGWNGRYFADRGDPAGTDLNNTQFSMSSAYDWDLSSIVPAGTKAVIISVQAKNSAAGAYLSFNKYGNSHPTINASYLYLPVANQYGGGQFIVPCSTGYKIHFIFNAVATWVDMEFTVCGWF